MTQFVLKEETFQIIGCCMEVHKQLGGGFSEVVYKDALQLEFNMRDMLFDREKKYTVSYKGTILPHCYFADFVAFDKVILEIKAVTSICDAHVAQTINYLKVSNCKVGLLINFGNERLEYRRFFYKSLWFYFCVNLRYLWSLLRN